MTDSPTSHLDALREHGRIDLGIAPHRAEALGAAAAALAASVAPTAVVHWSGDADAILAHLVASALDVPRFAVAVDEGLMSLSRALPASSRVLLVGVTFDAYRSVGPVAVFLAADGHEVVLAIAVDDATPASEVGETPLARM